MRIKINNRVATTLLIGLSLTACSTIDDLMTAEQVDYKSTVRGEPLTLPPDLSKAQINPQYSTHNGVASASAYDKAMADAKKQNKATGGVLPTNGEMQVLRSGDKRWLVINRDASAVYQEIIAFWGNEGFTINRENPTAGIIETDWAENRAKIPDNFLRRTLGTIIDMVSDSGERERFTTRLERINGKTEVYIRHERMVETKMDRDGTEFKWLPADEDQELNAVMLSRLMAYLGAPKQQAQEMVKTAQPVQQVQTTANFVNGDVALAIAASRESAYRQVGQALTASGFTIDRTDAAAGNYVVRYLDTDTGEKRKSSNIISRLWGDKGNKTPLPYTIHVAQSGSQSIVTVLDSEGNVDRSETAQRILTVIRDFL
ncbi:outer membrane protein assembly factor BamC [Pelistega ratti]|uniref:outer membrane protein assembly factor BamC n=1 Tax=Pelistega ratti TaxID=2652177 RepID=UPI001359ACFA|nr:outer membrane protein assembly factor BamC [Pelistega ratti]